YLALDRVEDALDACKKCLELNPDDYETGFLYARQLRGLQRRKEALAVLQKAVRSKGIHDRPDLLAQIWFDIGGLQEQEENWAEAEKSFREVLAILSNPRALLETGFCTAEDIASQAAETWERVGEACLKAGRPAQAIEAFQAARKKDPARGPRLALNLA